MYALLDIDKYVSYNVTKKCHEVPPGAVKHSRLAMKYYIPKMKNRDATCSNNH